MGLQPAILFLTIFFGLLPGIARAVPQEGDRLTEPYKSGTVRVSTDAQEGFGFIVGERDGDLYVVTAAHVVEEEAPGQPVPVRLHFYADQAKGVPAEVLLREPYLDAALLRVARPPRVEWVPQAYCTPPFERGEAVWFIGRDGGWYVPLDYEAGRLPRPEPDYRGRIALSIGSIKRGTSGAPLIGRRGLIGMITEDAGVNALALAVLSLRRFVTYYNYPWGLPRCGDTPASAPVASRPKPTPVTIPAATDKTWTDPVTGMEFVWIEGGCFQMGSPADEAGRDSDERQHKVCVHQGDGFWMGRTEFTNAQYRLFKRDHDSGEYKGHSLDGDQQPVVNVSWADAVAFVEWLSGQTGKTLRLPTEAEWEYAARAGSVTARYWGDDPGEACSYANVYDRTGNDVFSFSWEHHDCEDGFAVTAPVGRLDPNAWGLYDMLGNAWEWTCSEWDETYSGEEQKCSGKEHTNGRRVLRGGSWNNKPARARSANRNRREPDNRNNNLGFRLASLPAVPSIRVYGRG